MALDHTAIAQLTINRTGSPAASSHTGSMPRTKRICAATLLLLLPVVTLYWQQSKAIQPTANTTAAQVIGAKAEKPAVAAASAKNTIDVAPGSQNEPPRLATKVLDASGHIVARQVANVSSRVTGKLNALYLEEGQVIKKSEVIAEVDDEQAQINFQLAQAELASQQARLHESQVALKFSEKNFARQSNLLRQQLVSQQQVDNAERDYRQWQAQLNSQQAMIALSQRKVALAQYQLEQHKIRAPFTGVVISKNAQVGELISAGNSSGGSIRTGVATLVDMSSLEIEVEVSENYINRVHAGQKVIATLDAYPDWHIDSTVVAVVPTADRQKASIRVRVKMLQNDSRIYPDMSVKVSFFAA